MKQPTAPLHPQNKECRLVGPRLSAVVYVQAPLDDIYDLNFMAEPPSGVSAQVLTPISVRDVLGEMPKRFRGVRVHATSNKKEAILKGPNKSQ